MTDNDTVPIPPKDAERYPTVCRYCIVGCGYEVYKWPVGKEGGPKAGENALGIDYPAQQLGGQGVTPNQHTIIEEDGQEYHAIVKPDSNNPVNTIGRKEITRSAAVGWPNRCMGREILVTRTD